MLPLLRFATDGIEHSSKEAIEILSKKFNLTKEEKELLYATKIVSIFYEYMSESNPGLNKYYCKECYDYSNEKITVQIVVRSLHAKIWQNTN